MSARSDSRSTDDRIGGATDPPLLVRVAPRELVVALATWSLLHLLEQCAPADPGELLALRWLRTASEHPLRMSLAAAIVTYGLFGSARACQSGSPNERARKNP